MEIIKKMNTAIAVAKQNQIPVLVQLRKYPKIKDVSLSEIVDAINYISKMINEKDKLSTEDRLEKLEIIVATIKNSIIAEKYTLQEVVKAVQLATMGELNVEMFQSFDLVVLGKVMKAYTEYYRNNRAVKKYKIEMMKKKLQLETVLTEEQKLQIIKDGVQASYEDYLSGDYIVDRFHPSFHYLYKAQKMKVTDATSKLLDQKVAEKVKLREIERKTDKQTTYPDINEKFMKRAYATEMIFAIAKQEGIKNILEEEIINTEF